MSNIKSDSRVAIITGGSRGIGRATVKTLAAAVVNFASNRTEAEAEVAGVTDMGGRAVAVRGDVADDVVRKPSDSADLEFGGVDVVVHAAGRMVLGAIAELDLGVLDTNIRGTFVVNQLAARRFVPGVE